MVRMLLTYGILAFAAAVVGATVLTAPHTTVQKTDARLTAGIEPSAMMRTAPLDLPVESYAAH